MKNFARLHGHHLFSTMYNTSVLRTLILQGRLGIAYIIASRIHEILNTDNGTGMSAMYYFFLWNFCIASSPLVVTQKKQKQSESLFAVLQKEGTNLATNMAAKWLSIPCVPYGRGKSCTSYKLPSKSYKNKTLQSRQPFLRMRLDWIHCLLLLFIQALIFFSLYIRFPA